MAIPLRWVEHLFARLAVRYGGAFMRQYGDADPVLVQADWADVLDGLSGDDIGYALRYLPAERPPNAMQFREIARRAPNMLPPALPEPPADPSRVAAAMAAVRGTRGTRGAVRRNAAQDCINAIEASVERSGRLGHAQRHVLAACMAMPGTQSRLMPRAVEPADEAARDEPLRATLARDQPFAPGAAA